MSQAEINAYLEAKMKKVYTEVRIDGALTHDKVEKYLEYLARTASQTLIKVEMDKKKVLLFSQKTKPLLVDIGTKKQLTDSDIQKHTREITEKAEDQVEEIKNPKQEDTPAEEIEAESDPSQVSFLDQEIVPVGFEKGAPRISVKSFLELPITEKDLGPVEGNWFAAHIKYLEMAVKKSCFSKTDLEDVRKLLKKVPVMKYESYFNIFPDKDYEDTRMMIAYSRWRNKTLVPLSAENEETSE